MSKSDAAAVFTFTITCGLAGVTPKALRGWLDRGQVDFGGADREEGGWRRFTFAEIFQIAIIGSIVKYGLGVSLANEVVRAAVRPKLGSSDLVGRDALNRLKDPIHFRIGDDGTHIQFSPDELRDDIGDYLTIKPVVIFQDILERGSRIGEEDRARMVEEDVLGRLVARAIADTESVKQKLKTKKVSA